MLLSSANNFDIRSLSRASRLPIVIFLVNCVLGIFFVFSPENKGNKLVCFCPRICLDADRLPIDAYHPWQSTAATINWWLSIRELASVILLPHRYRLQRLANQLQRLSRLKIKAWETTLDTFPLNLPEYSLSGGSGDGLFSEGLKTERPSWWR